MEEGRAFKRKNKRHEFLNTLYLIQLKKSVTIINIHSSTQSNNYVTSTKLPSIRQHCPIQEPLDTWGYWAPEMWLVWPELCTVNKITGFAMAGVAQWIECWPMNQRVTSSIPSQGTCLGCRLGPQGRVCGRQPHIDVSLPLFLPSYPSL